MKLEQKIGNSILLLQKEFVRIKKMEYVRSVRKGSTGIGATFESLLGKVEDSLELPDFYGIEIKARRGYSKSKISLFNAVPTGSSFYEVKRLRDIYGYRDVNDYSLKRLNVSVVANEMVEVGVRYFFKLRVDRKQERLYLCVYDEDKKLVDEATFWDFELLKEKLFRKLQVLAVVKAWPNRIGGVEYFKYYKLNIYLLRGFQTFVDLLEIGKISVIFRIGNYYDEHHYGQVCSHGVGFVIAEEDLVELFECYR